ncbi:unnamed protein product, partial [Rotaria sp. Silwood1]
RGKITKCSIAVYSKPDTVWYGKQFHRNKNFLWDILVCLVCLFPLVLLIPLIRNRVLQWDEIEKIEEPKRNFRSKIRKLCEPFNRFYYGNACIRFRYNMVCMTVLYKNELDCINHESHEQSACFYI